MRFCISNDVMPLNCPTLVKSCRPKCLSLLFSPNGSSSTESHKKFLTIHFGFALWSYVLKIRPIIQTLLMDGVIA